jgi:hypothetical protein
MTLAAFALFFDLMASTILLPEGDFRQGPILKVLNFTDIKFVHVFVNPGVNIFSASRQITTFDEGRQASFEDTV